ncbi:hypothetical protein RND81_14G140500 [Saponaria officinalis]|uniref:Protease Do-like 14 n=1 Tax=Saponaria officinalis TaxID=3572 RepID=A0AAW1GPL5_SAPOF
MKLFLVLINKDCNCFFLCFLFLFSGDEQLFICCGIIMECEASICTTLTSATLLRSPDGSPKLAANIKIDVYVGGGKSVEGRVVGVDFHYNVAILEFYHDPPVSIPEVMCVDNVLEVGVRASLYSNVPVNTSNRYKLSHGDKVLALARYFQEPYDIMIAIGEVSFDYCQLDCKELLKASCKIKKNGIGGPLINLYGEVIGINFYHASYTPFLPMNIIIKCFKDLKENGPRFTSFTWSLGQ